MINRLTSTPATPDATPDLMDLVQDRAIESARAAFCHSRARQATNAETYEMWQREAARHNANVRAIDRAIDQSEAAFSRKLVHSNRIAFRSRWGY